MFAKLFKSIQTYIHHRPRIKKVAGVFLILVGFIALVTPLTPGAWLGIVGLELLGIRVVFFDKFKFWKKK
jgi:drug/metabolite transporter (DMT)-like permease